MLVSVLKLGIYQKEIIPFFMVQSGSKKINHGERIATLGVEFRTRHVPNKTKYVDLSNQL
jgi:hypothetical protein